MIRPVESYEKDKKIKVFELVRKGSGRFRRYHKTAAGDDATYWAHYRSVTGREYVGTNVDTLRRQAVYTINFHENIEEGVYIEDLCLNRIFVVKYVDRKEGYVGDLILSVLESRDADNIPREPEI